MILASIHLETAKKGECLNKFFALITILSLVLGFQNCGQSGLESGGSLGTNKISVTLPQLGQGKAVADVTYIEIPEADQAGSSQKLSGEISTNRLVISIQTGVIQLTDDTNAVLEKRCLSAASLNELHTILGGSTVCAAAPPSSEMCGERYKPAYVSLYADEARVNLGEEQDSCGTGRKDLCGDLATVFQNYVSYVKSHYMEMNCQ